ncbi:MAG: molecular chaperone DnaJ [Alphaproteobacteria bacterium]|nr:molecular chaperone DnaJ [Alphaproteobacteria bacterium]
MTQTYYETLEIQITATDEDIKRAFRSKAKECHPDHHSGPDAEARFKRLAEAYETLRDPQKRAAYDQYGHEAYTSGGGRGGFGGFDFGGAGFESIFEEIFNSFTGGGRPSAGAARGDDVRFDLTLSLEEAYGGLQKDISATTWQPCDACGGAGGRHVESCTTCGGRGHVRQRQGFFIVDTPCPVCRGSGKTIKDPCPECRGAGRVKKKRTLQVNIPAGVDSGVRMRLAGEGDAGLHGGGCGDLYVFLTIAEHPVFKRAGADLTCDIPIPMTTAALGGEVAIPKLGGGTETIAVKAGTQSGARVKIKGKGMPVLQARAVGDLIVTLAVQTPTNLTRRQKELLRDFDAA